MAAPPRPKSGQLRRSIHLRHQLGRERRTTGGINRTRPPVATIRRHIDPSPSPQSTRSAARSPTEREPGGVIATRLAPVLDEGPGQRLATVVGSRVWTAKRRAHNSAGAEVPIRSLLWCSARQAARCGRLLAKDVARVLQVRCWLSLASYTKPAVFPPLRRSQTRPPRDFRTNIPASPRADRTLPRPQGTV